MCSVVWLDLALKMGRPTDQYAVPFRWSQGWEDAWYFEASFVLFMCMNVVCLEKCTQED